MVIALVGRRIDPARVEVPVFPESEVSRVKQELVVLFKTEEARVLICSAACGADLVALEAAGALGIRRHIVLPFDPAKFRETSVTDRPGDWGAIYDAVVAEVEAAGDLVVLGLSEDSDETYAQANQALLREARKLAEAYSDRIAAVLVWNRVARGGNDVTRAFGDAARSAGLRVLEVSTVP